MKSRLRKVSWFCRKGAREFCRHFENKLGYYRSPEEYWAERHRKYGFDLRGVGHKGLSHEKNQQMYIEARGVFLKLCREEGVDFATAHMLDVGCGTGFYAKIFSESGGSVI